MNLTKNISIKSISDISLMKKNEFYCITLGNLTASFCYLIRARLTYPQPQCLD